MASGDVVHVAAPRTRAPRSTNTSGRPPVEPGQETVRPVASTQDYEEKVGPDPREHEWHRDDAGCVLGGTCGSEHHVPVQPRLRPRPFESASQNAPSRMRGK